MRAALLVVIAAVSVGYISAETNEDILKRLLGEDLEKRLLKYLENGAKPTPVRGNLACPIPLHGRPRPRTEQNCTRDSDCASDEKCCDWADNQHCLKGIDKTPSRGMCPQQNMWNDECLHRPVGCRYDSECTGVDEKCCFDFKCGNNECQSIRQHLTCPRNTSLERNTTYLSCRNDADCDLEEKCCDGLENGTVCVPGLDTVEKPGFCPAPLESANPSCEANHVDCEYDLECEGATFKCCNNTDCNYMECTDMNRDFACPWLDTAGSEINPTNEVPTCYPGNTTCPGFGLLCCPIGMSVEKELVHQCVPAILHAPRAGRCPPPEALQHPDAPCLENYSGNCGYDGDCYSDHKCCETACGYSQCLQLPNPEHIRLERLLEVLGVKDKK